jgi:hypothetical protein
MKKLLFGTFAAALLLMAACKNSGKKPSSEDILKAVGKSPNINAGSGNFEIQPPVGWTRIDTTVSGLRATLLMAPIAAGDNFQTNVNVVSESMSNTTLDRYFDISLSNMGKFMQNFTNNGTGDKEVNGVHSKWLKYSQSPNGLGLDAICYIIPSNGIAYLITCTAPKGQLDKYQPQFDEAISSFKVHQ